MKGHFLRHSVMVVSFACGLMTSCSQPVLLLAGSVKHEQQGFQDGNGAEVRLKSPRIAYSDGSRKGLFIADSENNRIRFMDKSGQVSTFAGDGTANEQPIISGSEFKLQSQVYRPGSIHIADDRLYFTSPGCLRSIDLSDGISAPSIRTLHGTCMTQSDWQELRKPEASRAFQNAKDPYYWGYAQYLSTDESRNVYILAGSSLQRISSEGVISQVHEVYAHSFGLANHQNQSALVFHYHGGFVPGAAIVTQVAEINSENVSKDIADFDIGEIIKVTSDGGEGFFAIAGHADYHLYKIDHNFKPIPLQTFRVNGTPESMVYSKSEKSLFIATASAIYKIDLSSQPIQ